MAVNLSQETPNYVEQFRSLQQRGGFPPGLPITAHHFEPSQLLLQTKWTDLLEDRKEPAAFTVPRSYSPPPVVDSSSMFRGRLSYHTNDVNGARHPSDEVLTDRRDSAGTNSNVSSASAASHKDPEDAESSKVDGNVPTTSSNIEEEGEGPDFTMSIPSPKSEASFHSSMDGEEAYENKRQKATSYNNLLQQQLMARRNTLLNFRLTRREGGGSDAEAEHTSTSHSPGSSRSDELSGMLPDEVAPGQLLCCEFCNFTNTSRFHFNSHMNTHCVHRCYIPDCNYSTRTEGRLRRHVKNHHASDPNDGETSMDDGKGRGKKNSDDVDDQGNQSLTKANATPAKQKSWRCKQCADFIATNKNDYYDHQRTHIKVEKLLSCPLDGCRFVTEYKHHLEYHVRNHQGSKPFKCSQPNCTYTCVNKSMLNSHMKSHSSHYQFQCDCGYVTKYCHSLKLHLKKYKHTAKNVGSEASQLSMAGSPQPPQILTSSALVSSLVGDEASGKQKKRRNSRKNINQEPSPPTSSRISPHPFQGFHPMAMRPNVPVSMSMGDGAGPGGPVQMPPGFAYGMYGPGGAISPFHAASIYNNLLLSAAAANGLMPSMPMNRFVRPPHISPEPEVNVKRESPSPSESDAQQEQPRNYTINNGIKKESSALRMFPSMSLNTDRQLAREVTVASPLDLSGGKENGSDRHSESPRSDGSSNPAGAAVSSRSRRRKGPAFKLEAAVRQRLQDNLAGEEEDDSEMKETCTVVQPESPEAFNQSSLCHENDVGDGWVKVSPSKRVYAASPSSVIKPLVNGAKRGRRELLCEYCAMSFEDSSMFAMHMGLHGSPQDPFTCVCGHSAEDKVSFFQHIAKAPHY
ncbi:hypothetical protein RvY_14679 [Ramazzottius varieornatus]|uniref:C2H2-type domain-containing protein n=1 Tax=Ramazzottius varieornatus TaxID=947166 RepID=A0A1D1VS71_RAMVA|nr:hypothetical protein RvY_14679 [Ramazzottius varieornatus]